MTMCYIRTYVRTCIPKTVSEHRVNTILTILQHEMVHTHVHSTQQEEATVSLERKNVTQLPMNVRVQEIHSSIPVFLFGVTSILLHQVVKELSPSVPGSTLEAVEATSLHAQASYMMKH